MCFVLCLVINGKDIWSVGIETKLGNKFSKSTKQLRLNPYKLKVKLTKITLKYFDLITIYIYIY